MSVPDADSVEQFAADLRELRVQAGDPTLEVLAGRCGIGRTVLSGAFRGQALPTRNTVTGIVTALGGDERAWVQRWMRLRAAGVTPVTELDIADAGDRAVAAHDPMPMHRWGMTVVIGVVCLVVGFLVGFVVTRPKPAPAPPLSSVTTGADPWVEPGCQADAVRKSFATRADHYLVEVFWSKTCQAVWGQVTRFDGQYAGNTLTVSVYPGLSPTSPQTTTAEGVQTVHTPLLVRPGEMTTVCVTGQVGVGAGTIDLSPPVCVDYR